MTVTTVYRDDLEVQAAKGGENLRLRLTGIDDDDIAAGFVVCSRNIVVPTVTYFNAQLQARIVFASRAWMKTAYMAASQDCVSELVRACLSAATATMAMWCASCLQPWDPRLFSPGTMSGSVVRCIPGVWFRLLLRAAAEPQLRMPSLSCDTCGCLDMSNRKPLQHGFLARLNVPN